MDEDPENTTISVHLSRVLDEIGLNELTVKQRRETNLYKEHALSLYSEIFENMTVHIFGSQQEGSTTFGLKSDVDILYVYDQFKVIQDMTEWTEGRINLLMIREGAAPGYCRLQRMKRDRPEPAKTLPNQDYTYDESNRVILNNSVFDKYDTGYLLMNQNGPAQTFKIPYCYESDITYAFKCTSRLEASEKWVGRKKRGGWPTVRVIKQAVNEPFFLVPVGYKLSPTKSIEWRISTSLAEICLMFSLNIVRIKCYVILKLLMKTFVTPEVGKSISSYHCKTTLLYCMESAEADFWREDNLIQSITRCLEMILALVTDQFCPHFIIAKANLFAGKVTLENKSQIQFILHYLIRCNVESILDVSIDRLGHRLLEKLGTRPRSSPILDSIETYNLLGCLEVCRQSAQALNELPINLSFCNQAVASANIQKAITMLKYKTNVSDKKQQEANGHFTMFLYSLQGSSLASSFLGRNERISQEAIDLLNVSAASDISFLLKQASVLYCSGEVEQVENLCKKVDCFF